MSEGLDLIDRNELYNQIRLHLNRHSLGETAPWTTLTTGEIASIIANMPKVEVVRHGKWINVSDLGDKVQCRCSRCFSSDVHSKGMVIPYCWRCGARMDGK